MYPHPYFELMQEVYLTLSITLYNAACAVELDTDAYQLLLRRSELMRAQYEMPIE